MIFVYVSATILVCYKWGDWKSWREYYPTCLYFIIGDFIYKVLFYEHTLWQFEGLINHTFSDFMVSFLAFPALTIFFLTHYPKPLWLQTLYILLFTGIHTIIEFILFKTGNIIYHNGWNIFWSMAVVWFLALTAIRLHYRSPLLAWVMVIVGFGTAMFLFNIPISSLGMIKPI